MALTCTSQAYQTRRLQPRQSPGWQRGEDSDAPLFWFLSAILAGGAVLFLALYWLCQPTINANPGIAGYIPLPGTRLVPLARKSDAPELADLPADPPVATPLAPPSPLTALAKADAGEQPGKRELHPSVRKRQRTDSSEHDQRRLGFVQPWNFGSPGLSNPHVMSGGPKSWF